jgi:predicted ester cyclase
LFGIPPTGKRVTVDHVEIWRIEDGKIVEQWGGTWEFERIANELRCDA